MPSETIKWGDKYKGWDDARKVEYLEKGWGSSNYALDLMQQERNILLTKASEMQRLLDAGQQALDLQKSINHQVITENNERLQRDASEIQKLKGRIRDLLKAKVG